MKIEKIEGIALDTRSGKIKKIVEVYVNDELLFNATQEGKIEEGSVAKHPRIAHGKNVLKDGKKVREEKGGQASNRHRAVGKAEVRRKDTQARRSRKPQIRIKGRKQ